MAVRMEAIAKLTVHKLMSDVGNSTIVWRFEDFWEML
jgi:hypothetical protein